MIFYKQRLDHLESIVTEKQGIEGVPQGSAMAEGRSGARSSIGVSHVGIRDAPTSVLICGFSSILVRWQVKTGLILRYADRGGR